MSKLRKKSNEKFKDVKVTLGPFPSEDIKNKKISIVLEESEIRVFYGIDTENRRVVWVCGVNSYDFNPGWHGEERFVGIIDHALPKTNSPDANEWMDANIEIILPESYSSKADQIRTSFLKFYDIFYDNIYSEISNKLQEFDKAIEDQIETVVWGDETCLVRLCKK